jgi:Terpene cyclase DEP1
VKKNIYLVLVLLGLLIPYYFLFKFLGSNGLNISLLVQQLFANNISTFFAVDLVISIIVFWIYMFAEVNKLQMKNSWLYLLASLIVGLSFALPLFLYFRERQLQSTA